MTSTGWVTVTSTVLVSALVEVVFDFFIFSFLVAIGSLPVGPGTLCTSFMCWAVAFSETNALLQILHLKVLD